MRVEEHGGLVLVVGGIAQRAGAAGAGVNGLGRRGSVGVGRAGWP